MLEIYKEVEPLYMQLHAYVRRKLFVKYGKVIISNVFIHYVILKVVLIYSIQKSILHVLHLSYLYLNI